MTLLSTASRSPRGQVIADLTEEVQHIPAGLDSPGVIAVLGLNRLRAAEDVVRSAAGTITIALVSSHPDELGPLARYTTGSLLGCLQQSLPAPRLQLVHDESGVLASALGCEVIGDDLVYAAAIADGRILTRAEGFGAAYTLARTAGTRGGDHHSRLWISGNDEADT